MLWFILLLEVSLILVVVAENILNSSSNVLLEDSINDYSYPWNAH